MLSCNILYQKNLFYCFILSSARDSYDEAGGIDYNVLTMLAEFALDESYGCAEGTTDVDLPGSIGIQILQTIAASDAGVYAQFLLAMYALQLRHSIEGPARDVALPHQINGSERKHPLVIMYTAVIKHKLPEAIAYLQQLFSKLASDERGDWIDWAAINSRLVDQDLMKKYERPVCRYLANYRS